ncbi:hypothetical protein AAFF_G00042060 [Aldrovandia affinis]|uniref:Uncharacterized protein n=1 Tax=Aldrovandia affinis TaxID=143900 RepID=A0AAD7S4X9_9TELE|nr:hypothetical protein AAFF_G00042060 [Aldrovandia affinis]
MGMGQLRCRYSASFGPGAVGSVAETHRQLVPILHGPGHRAVVYGHTEELKASFPTKQATPGPTVTTDDGTASSSSTHDPAPSIAPILEIAEVWT